MGGKTTIEQRSWRWFLLLHETFYTIAWALSFYTLAFFPPYQSDRTLPLLLLLWTPFLIIHIAAYFHYAARPKTTEIERQAYREGFADGMRDHAKLNDSYDSHRIAIDDEGEFVEAAPEYSKRKRELQ